MDSQLLEPPITIIIVQYIGINMKTKIDITSSVHLDEIKYKLIENLSTTDLINFAIDMVDDYSEAEEYYSGLKNKLNKLRL